MPRGTTTEPFDVGRIQGAVCSLEAIRCSDNPDADTMILRAITLANQPAESLSERYGRAVAVSRALFPIIARYASLKQWTTMRQVEAIAKDVGAVAAQLQLQLDLWAEIERIRQSTQGR